MSMKTASITYKCRQCHKFEVTHPVDTNEHGYFAFPEAYCPECFSLMPGEACDKKDIREIG